MVNTNKGKPIFEKKWEHFVMGYNSNLRRLVSPPAGVIRYEQCPLSRVLRLCKKLNFSH